MAEFLAENLRATAEAMNDPQRGDRFCEMYCFWVYVIDRQGDRVTYLEASAPCTFPDDAKRTECSIGEWKARFMYRGGSQGSWIHLVERGNRIPDEWLTETATRI